MLLNLLRHKMWDSEQPRRIRYPSLQGRKTKRLSVKALKILSQSDATPAATRGVKSESESSLLKETPNSGHVLLIDCTLSLVLRSFGRCTVLDGRTVPQECPVVLRYTISTSHRKS